MASCLGCLADANVLLPCVQTAAELLQSIGWWPPHLQFNLLSAGISEHFAPELEVGWSRRREEAGRPLQAYRAPAPSLQAAAQQLLASPPPDADASRRRDFTASHAVVTIDDASTTEIDDGISLERLADGSSKVC